MGFALAAPLRRADPDDSNDSDDSAPAGRRAATVGEPRLCAGTGSDASVNRGWRAPARSRSVLQTFGRERRPDLPVILSSGWTGDEIAGTVAQHANTRFLGKPYHPSELLLVVELALEPLDD